MTNGVSGLLVSERDVEGLTASLLRIVENPDRWKAMGAAASDAVAVKFAQPHQIESLEAAYFEAIEQWRKGRNRWVR